MNEKKYRTFPELQELTAKRNREFHSIDPQYLNEEGRLLRDVWQTLSEIFENAANLDDAIMDVCLSIDTALDASQWPFANRSYYSATIHKLVAFIKAQTPKDIWSGYPLIVDPMTA